MEKVETIFEHAKSFWPDSINIADGKFIEDISGFKSGNLTLAWENAERKSSGNDWDELGVWIIYKLLHKRAILNFEQKIFFLSVSQLSITHFKESLFEELQQKGYEQMLKELTTH